MEVPALIFSKIGFRKTWYRGWNLSFLIKLHKQMYQMCGDMITHHMTKCLFLDEMQLKSNSALLLCNLKKLYTSWNNIKHIITADTHCALSLDIWSAQMPSPLFVYIMSDRVLPAVKRWELSCSGCMRNMFVPRNYSKKNVHEMSQLHVLWHKMFVSSIENQGCSILRVYTSNVRQAFSVLASCPQI